TYDANGNLESDGSRTFTWDAKNRLKSVTVAGDTYSWDYDGRDRRLTEKKNNVLQKEWIWDQADVVQERDLSGAVIKNFFNQGERHLSGTSTRAYVYTRDHLGSIREMVDSAGMIRARYDYDAYGAVTKLGGDFDAQFRYTGHLYHSVSNLHLALYRAYDPELGRWISRDPLKSAELLPEGTNLYNYVGGNPTNFVDPDGRVAIADDIIIIGGAIVIGGVIILSDPQGQSERAKFCRAVWDSFVNSSSQGEERPKKVPKPGVSGKEGAKDKPSWAAGERPYVDESGDEFADRLCDRKYGKGNYRRGASTEHSKIKKWGDRSFQNPKK
ncbi:MAG: hypothetical protein EOP09_06590, partial [Proteobacteria bacterium]